MAEFPAKLLKLLGMKVVQEYIIKEIQKVYVSQGVSINDKHVELIVRQMFSRVKIKDSGDSRFSADEIISKARMLAENEDLEKLFRLDTSTKTIGSSEEKGSGLGLILCKEFVEKNGGTIGATSEYGKGSCFYIKIPCSKA